MARPKASANPTTQARRWLEAQNISIPDPWTTPEVATLIDASYPGGRKRFLKDIGAWPSVRQRWHLRRRRDQRGRYVRAALDADRPNPD